MALHYTAQHYIQIIFTQIVQFSRALYIRVYLYVFKLPTDQLPAAKGAARCVAFQGN